MEYFKATEISAAGMAVQKARIEAAALNLANMHSSIAPGTRGFQPVKAVIEPQPAFTAALSGTASRPLQPTARLIETTLPVRTSYEPGHPHADAAGWVAYPAVDHTQEMLTVVSALRTYEANLEALQVGRTLAIKALEIGGQ